MTLVFLVVGICAVLPAILLILHLSERNKPVTTIYQRIAALEEAMTANATGGTDTAKAADLTALADRVTAIEGEIGTDVAPAAQQIDPATGLPVA